MKMLVTGGAGFIGSHYVRALLAGQYPETGSVRITVLDKLTYAGNTANLPSDDGRLTFVRGDVCDSALLADLLPGHDAVIHFAAETHVDRSLISGSSFVRTNALGTQTVLEVSARTGVERVVCVSTDEVYGSIARGSWTETSPLRPNSPYAASKAAADLLARAYWRSHDLNVSVTRCCNNYGPYQYGEKLIPLFVTNLLDGLDVPLYGTGAQMREWLHVDDHCRAVHQVLLAGRAGEIYNIGSGCEVSNKELTTRLLKLCHASWTRVRHVPDRKAHDARYSVDTTKIRSELGFVSRIQFDQGLAEVVNWHRENRDWWEAQRRAARIPIERPHKDTRPFQ